LGLAATPESSEEISMAGFLQRILGGGKRAASSNAAKDRNTFKAARAVESEARVETICSGQFKSAAQGKCGREEKDNGPWFIGKTVGEIFQIRGVLGHGGMGIVYRAVFRANRRCGFL